MSAQGALAFRVARVVGSRRRLLWGYLVVVVLLCFVGVSSAAATERVRITFSPRSTNTSIGVSEQTYDSVGNYADCYVAFPGDSLGFQPKCTNTIPQVTASVSGSTVTIVDQRSPSTRCLRTVARDSGPYPYQADAKFFHPNGSQTDSGPVNLPTDHSDRAGTYLGSTPVESQFTVGAPFPFTYQSPCQDPTPPPPCQARPFAYSERFNRAAGGRLTATLRAIPEGAPIARWRLIRQSFGTGTWQFHWGGNGTFSIALLHKASLRFIYSVIDTHGCQSASATVTINIRSGTVNHPPVARPDHWTVNAGATVEGNVLANDHDPDGDPIRARFVRISFARTEWSGLEAGGTFLYTAGPGTARTLHKKITYVAIDSHGARSKPVTSEVTLVVPKRAKPPIPRHVSRTAQLTPLGPAASTAQQSCSLGACWYPGGYGSWKDCFGSGVHTECWVLLSTMETQALNRATPWLKKPSFSELRQACLPENPKDITAKNCAQGIAGLEFNHLWNKGIIQAAASAHHCLAFRVARHRTLRHPKAGAWGDPEYDTLNSGVPPWQNDNPVSGWVYWTKGFLGHIRIQVPLLCNTDGRTWLWWPANPTQA